VRGGGGHIIAATPDNPTFIKAETKGKSERALGKTRGRDYGGILIAIDVQVPDWGPKKRNLSYLRKQ
jgi:hypothetical protein